MGEFGVQFESRARIACGVWAFAKYGTEDVGVRRATWLSASAAEAGPWVGVIDAILSDDKQRPMKQWHTSKVDLGAAE